MPTLLLFAASLFSAGAPVHAAPLFTAPYLSYGSGAFPYALAVADVNRDGKPDVVTANMASSTVSVLLGNGDGTFVGLPEQPTGVHPRSVTIADFDRDGRPDLGTANDNDVGTFSILLGRGDGTFLPPVDYVNEERGMHLAVADLNADHRPDLVTAGEHSISVRLGLGDGTFADERGPGGRGTSVIIADVDADGRLDLVTTEFVLIGNGDGSFKPPIHIGSEQEALGTPSVTATGPSSSQVALGDLNGDGRLDLALTTDANAVYVLLGNGNGTFGAASLFWTGMETASVVIGDFNADGRPDLVTANANWHNDSPTETVTVLLGVGDGTFAPRLDIGTGAKPCAVASADFDGDGHPDLAVANTYANTVSILLGNGDGTFGPRTESSYGFWPYLLAAADLDGDGRTDFAVTNAQARGVTVLHGNGDGTFDVGGTFDLSDPRGLPGAPTAIAVADLDSDGRVDLAAASKTWVSVLRGVGDGTFRDRADFGTDWAASALVIADLDVDGRPDLVTANTGIGLEYPSTVSVLLGNGDGSFAEARHYRTGRYTTSLAVADLDADGVPDVVTASYFSRTVSVLLGRGDGTFAARTDYATRGSTAAVAIGDLDADGRPDLAVTHDGIVAVLFGRGDGTFRDPVDLAGARGGGPLAIADINADDQLDIVVADARANAISALLGNGDGTFTPTPGFGTGTHPSSLAIGDFDSDRRVDLAVVNSASRSLSLLRNRGPFPPFQVTVGLTPRTLETASHGRWVTGVLTPDAPRRAGEIDVASIRLNGSVPVDPSGPVVLRRGGGELMVRFDRDALLRALPPGEQVTVRVTGKLGDEAFAGADTVRVLRGSRAAVDDETEGSAVTAPRVLSLRLSSPNPVADGRLRLALSLLDDSPARLELLDVAGRVVSARTVEPRGAGVRELELAAGALRPGIYFVRLAQGASVVRVRAAVVP